LCQGTAKRSDIILEGICRSTSFEIFVRVTITSIISASPALNIAPEL